jgi:hypothetical protein
MKIKDLDNYSFITGVIVFVVVGLLVLVIASNKYITTECKKTTETRTTTSYIQSGNVFLPITMTQHRCICPGNTEAWM